MYDGVVLQMTNTVNKAPGLKTTSIKWDLGTENRLKELRTFRKRLKTHLFIWTLPLKKHKKQRTYLFCILAIG